MSHAPSSPAPLAPPAHPALLLPALVLAQVLLIIASNYLVQIPFQIAGLHTTWGAFTFPLVFVATDLTVRLLGAPVARQVIARVMLPALLASYAVSVLFAEGAFAGWAALSEFNAFVFRIALASFVAYVLGQWLDVAVFSRLHQAGRAWWLAPAASTVLGSALDTLVFFGTAFFRSSDPFMAEHWGEIALFDYATKLAVSLVCFLPLYKLALNRLVGRWAPAPTPAPV